MSSSDGGGGSPVSRSVTVGAHAHGERALWAGWWLMVDGERCTSAVSSISRCLCLGRWTSLVVLLAVSCSLGPSGPAGICCSSSLKELSPSSYPEALSNKMNDLIPRLTLHRDVIAWNRTEPPRWVLKSDSVCLNSLCYFYFHHVVLILPHYLKFHIRFWNLKSPVRIFQLNQLCLDKQRSKLLVTARWGARFD